MKLGRLLLAVGLALALGLGSSGLSQTQEVSFGYVEWPGVTVKTHVASAILETLGYETDMQALSVPLVFKGLSEGDLDAFLGVWEPSMASMVDPYLSDAGGDGTVTLVARNLEPTLYRPAVPTFVAEQGITSLADVAANADMFEGKVYGIEPGNDGNQILIDMIEADTYGFGALELVESSTEGMLTQVERAVEREEAIAFLAWSPHWMNAAYDLTYLDDPENVWGGDGYVATAMNSEVMRADANLVKFLEQYTVTPEMQDMWIDAYSRQGNDPAQVANDWIAANMDTVIGWVNGVTTASGESGAEALRAAFGN